MSIVSMSVPTRYANYYTLNYIYYTSDFLSRKKPDPAKTEPGPDKKKRSLARMIPLLGRISYFDDAARHLRPLAKNIINMFYIYVTYINVNNYILSNNSHAS